MHGSNRGKVGCYSIPLSEGFEKEKNIAIQRSFGDDAPILLKAPESNSVYQFQNRSYIGTIDFHFEKSSSTLHYKFSPFAEDGAKFIITKDWRDFRRQALLAQRASIQN
jgi:hypothetical protein